jgi:hypothetical protein
MMAFKLPTCAIPPRITTDRTVSSSLAYGMRLRLVGVSAYKILPLALLQQDCDAPNSIFLLLYPCIFSEFSANFGWHIISFILNAYQIPGF